jgi:tetratricopeptide (TPR) repeat protein
MATAGRLTLRRLAVVFGVCTLLIASVTWWRGDDGAVAKIQAAYKAGDWQAVSVAAEQRLRHAPGDAEATRLLARAGFRLGHDEEARALYRRLGPARLQAEDYYLLGLAMQRAGDPQVALNCWEAGKEADPARTDILEALARVDLGLSRYASALDVAASLATHRGFQARSDLIAAEARAGLGEDEASVECLERGLALDPRATGAPRSPQEYQKLLARAYLRTGRPGPARERLEAVLDQGADAEASWLLSRAFLQTGAWSDAQSALRNGQEYRRAHPVEPEPGPYVGAARCGECHGAIYKAEQSSRHARTFLHARAVPDQWLPGQPLRDPANANVTHRIVRKGSGIEFETRQPDQTLRAAVEFAFGSGDRGLTLVGRDEGGRARECRLSRYEGPQPWDVTTGQPPEPPAGEGYLGRILSADLVYLCLDCHTTRARSARDAVGPASADHGIGCERCHGPGENHVRAVSAEFVDLAIARPRPVPGGRSIHVCKQCHRSPGPKVERNDPNAVRFAATSLVWSACYSVTGGALDCVTCHDPHHNAVTTPGFYEDKCRSCHSLPDEPAATLSGATPTRRGSLCPVNPQDGCLNCHMPAVKGVIPHSSFTDHYIRVRRAPDGRR